MLRCEVIPIGRSLLFLLVYDYNIDILSETLDALDYR
jgi:hypothetical protein